MSDTQSKPHGRVGLDLDKVLKGAIERPWEVTTESTMFESQVVGPEVNGGRDVLHQGTLANSELIVLAVNSFEAMREALEAIVKVGYLLEGQINGQKAHDAVKAALAMAKGGKVDDTRDAAKGGVYSGTLDMARWRREYSGC